MVDQLMAGNMPPKTSAVLYFYCDYSSADSLDASRIVENLILQLLSTKIKIPEEIEQSLFEVYEGEGAPDFDVLINTLLPLIKLFGRVIIVLDGIDECAGSNRVDLMRFIHSIIKSDTTINLLLSSRPDPDISEAFSNYPCLQISGNDISADIESLVNGVIAEKLASRELVIRDPNLVVEISKALVDGAQGM